MDGLGTVLIGEPDILLREHKTAEHSLQADEVDLLRRELGGQLDVLPTYQTGIYTLQPHQHVGFVVLPSGRTIEIRPKIRVDVLFAMLTKAHHLADFGSIPQSYTSVADLFEFIVSFFVGMVEGLAARGILRSFVPIEDDLIALRGKLLLAETVRRYPVVRDHHCCAFTDFTPDILENRILKLACDELAPFPYLRIPELGGRLRRLLRVLSEVSLDLDAVEGCDGLAYHRLNEHYRPAVALARLLLRYLSPSGTRGRHQFLTFLVDMNRLFEQYVTVVLEEAAGRRGNIDVVVQDPHSLDLDRQVTVKPDIVLRRGLLPILVLDCKYKCDDPNTDVYQALAYCHAVGLPRAVLVYPAGAEFVARRHRIRPGSDIEVVLLTLDLSDGVAELQRHAEQFVVAAWGECARETEEDN